MSKFEILKEKIKDILVGYTIDMEQGHWYSSNEGVPESRYDLVADDIVELEKNMRE